MCQYRRRRSLAPHHPCAHSHRRVQLTVIGPRHRYVPIRGRRYLHRHGPGITSRKRLASTFWETDADPYWRPLTPREWQTPTRACVLRWRRSSCRRHATSSRKSRTVAMKVGLIHGKHHRFRAIVRSLFGISNEKDAFVPICEMGLC
jgi:hypothetical protein